MYGSVAFIRNKFASTSNVFSPNDFIDRHTALGDGIENWSQCHSTRGKKYCRQFGFLPLIHYQFSSYIGGGHLQTPDMVEWMTKAHQSQTLSPLIKLMTLFFQIVLDLCG